MDKLTRNEVAHDLPAVAGRRVVHTLTEAEIAEFINISTIEDELEAVRSVMLNDIHSDMAEQFKSYLTGDTTRAPENSGVSAAELDFLLMKISEYELSKKQFWHKIRKGRNCWNAYLEVAAGFTVVSNGPKIPVK